MDEPEFNPEDELKRLKSEMANLRAESRQAMADAQQAVLLMQGAEENPASAGGGFRLTRHLGGGGAAGIEGFTVYRKNTVLGTISIADAIAGWDPEEAVEDPDNWSLEFAVSGSALVAFGTTAPDGVYDTDLFDGYASADPVEAQTFYRIPMRRGGEWICRGGVFRENIMCAGSNGPIVELVRIG